MSILVRRVSWTLGSLDRARIHIHRPASRRSPMPPNGHISRSSCGRPTSVSAAPPAYWLLCALNRYGYANWGLVVTTWVALKLMSRLPVSTRVSMAARMLLPGACRQPLQITTPAQRYRKSDHASTLWLDVQTLLRRITSRWRLSMMAAVLLSRPFLVGAWTQAPSTLTLWLPLIVHADTTCEAVCNHLRLTISQLLHSMEAAFHESSAACLPSPSISTLLPLFTMGRAFTHYPAAPRGVSSLISLHMGAPPRWLRTSTRRLPLMMADAPSLAAPTSRHRTTTPSQRSTMVLALRTSQVARTQRPAITLHRWSIKRKHARMQGA